MTNFQKANKNPKQAGQLYNIASAVSDVAVSNYHEKTAQAVSRNGPNRIITHVAGRSHYLIA
jgi:hypothetical protein